ncbi:hypothetical protein BD769DRAFT_1671264 [Suillus cothurnatus]|nr:hypothetical protein BD769DRAFT_1671264 [Suillus cothurnatus]
MTSYSLIAHPSVSSPPTSEAPNEAPNGSLILKSNPPSLRRTSPVTPIKHRVASSPIPMHEARATYPIPSSSQSSPIQRVISPIPSSSPVVLLLKGLMNNTRIMTTQLYGIRLLASP